MESNLRSLAYEQTPLGPLCLRRRELLSSPGTVVTEIPLDHQFLMSSFYTASEEALARIALEMHPGTELDVLVGGLGLGYTAHAALQSPRVGRVLALELLPEVVEWIKTDLLSLSPALREDDQFGVETTDAYARLLGPANLPGRPETTGGEACHSPPAASSSRSRRRAPKARRSIFT